MTAEEAEVYHGHHLAGSHHSSASRGQGHRVTKQTDKSSRSVHPVMSTGVAVGDRNIWSSLEQSGPETAVLVAT